MAMTQDERMIGISVIIDAMDWSPYERIVLETMRQAIHDEVEAQWIETNRQHENLVATMWLKIYQNEILAAHVAAVIDMYRTQKNA